MSRQSIRSTSSATSEVGGVVPAVEHLQELARRMRSESFNFKDDDVSNIDVVVEAIHELEKERLRLHELLETETIRGSIIRHRLLFYPAEIQKEIDEAVISARQSNAEAQQSLQEKLESIYKNVEFLEDRQRLLEKENSVLHPERELIRQRHEEIISQLNQRMAEKASMQITLNETRDKVRQANQCILDLEDAIIQLKEDLIQERQDAREEKKRLKNAVNDTNRKTRDQRAGNFEKKKELDALKEEMVDSEGNLNVLKKSIKRLEVSRGKLVDKEKKATHHLKEEIKENETFVLRGIAIREEIQKETDEFESQKTALEKEIARLDSEITRHTKRSSLIEDQHAQLAAELATKITLENRNKVRVKELDKLLQTAKEAQSNKAEEVGRLENENKNLRQNLDEFKETHKVAIAQLNMQIEEHRDRLGKERKDRMELQSQRDSVQKDLEEIKQGSQKFMTEINKKINEGKTKHQELSKEGTHLQKQLREDDAIIRQLEQQLVSAQKQYAVNSTAKKEKLATIEKEIAEMEKALEAKKLELSTRTPAFQKLEILFEEKSNSYDIMKKGIVKTKNQKSGLEDAIKRARADKEKITAPQEEMKEVLKEKRKTSIAQLKSHAEETRDVEQEIFVASCKLKTVQDENLKFEQHIQKLHEGIVSLSSQKKENADLKVILHQELEKLKEELIRGWKDDGEMEKFFARRDEAVVEELAEVLKKTERREMKVADISSQLQSELIVLGEFLDNVSRRRPLEKKKKMKKTPEKVNAPRYNKWIPLKQLNK
ncbi:polyamine-modulated factor 1-binding protein 1-like isoform X2 [Liolophura sinensis]|uniref:polyamine-modulated factor 1-binding protein 1-like isoform X2 n=1 Tax=Liolophura sinensis TaxID=3198878 RepID=UPI003158130F